jgi:hypothetical protein
MNSLQLSQAESERYAHELGLRLLQLEAVEHTPCGCNGMCDGRGGCPLQVAAQARHAQTLELLANEQVFHRREVRNFCLDAARKSTGEERAAWASAARFSGHQAVRAARTGRQARALIGHDFKRGDLCTELLPEYDRPTFTLWMRIVWWLIAVTGVASGLFMSAQDAHAGTLDLEVSVGANITPLLSGNPKFGAGSDGGFEGPRDTIEFAVVWRSDSGRWFCKLSHISHLSAGPPFNDRPEDFLERLEVGYRWRMRGGL